MVYSGPAGVCLGSIWLNLFSEYLYSAVELVVTLDWMKVRIGNPHHENSNLGPEDDEFLVTIRDCSVQLPLQSAVFTSFSAWVYSQDLRGALVKTPCGYFWQYDGGIKSLLQLPPVTPEIVVALFELMWKTLSALSHWSYFCMLWHCYHRFALMLAEFWHFQLCATADFLWLNFETWWLDLYFLAFLDFFKTMGMQIWCKFAPNLQGGYANLTCKFVWCTMQICKINHANLQGLPCKFARLFLNGFLLLYLIII